MMTTLQSCEFINEYTLRYSWGHFSRKRELIAVENEAFVFASRVQRAYSSSVTLRKLSVMPVSCGKNQRVYIKNFTDDVDSA